jgi:hypothetical protein
MTTADVKKRVKDNTYPQPLRLLVANATTYDYYKKQKKPINSKLPSVQKLPLDRNDQSPSPIDSTEEGMFIMFFAFFFKYVLYI